MRRMKLEEQSFRAVIHWVWHDGQRIHNETTVIGPYANPTTVKGVVTQEMKWYKHRKGFEIMNFEIQINKGWETYAEANEGVL